MGLEKNLADSLTDEAYDPANSDNYDDGEDDEDEKQYVITTSDMALVTDTLSTFLHHLDVKPTGCTNTFGSEKTATLNIQQELYKGMGFVDVLSLRYAVKLYVVRTHQTFWVRLSKHGTEDYRCPQYWNGCQWRVRVMQNSPKHPYQITQCN